MLAVGQCIWNFIANARAVILLLAVLFVIPGLWTLPVSLDQQLFKLISSFSTIPTVDAKISSIEVPDDIGTQRFANFLLRLETAKPDSIVFIGKPEGPGLRKLLRKSKIPVGVDPELNKTDGIAFSTTTRIAPAKLNYREHLFSQLLPQPKSLDLPSGVRQASLFVPLSSYRSGTNDLVWLQGRLAIPDLVLRLFVSKNKNQIPRWQNGIGLIKSDGLLASGPDGRIRVPESLDVSTALYSVNEFGRNEYLDQFRDQAVLLGHGPHTEREAVAKIVYAIDSGVSVFTPAWSIWLAQGLIIFAVIYLFFILQRLSLRSNLAASGVVVLSLLVAQSASLLLAGQWLPFTNLILLLVVGHGLMLVTLRTEMRLARAYKDRDIAMQELGCRQIDAGEYDLASTTLSSCVINDDVLDKLYSIGIEFERQRRYDKAFRVFSRIARQRKGFKDTAQRLESLASIQDQQNPVANNFNGANTLVIPSLGLEHPVLGRYELTRELGRGAMGVVYLGHDPKIVRDVAIKTIDLKQFNGKEAEEIKIRFFREAEAAGRLNHPNVVTVYDVGEEHDLAFIAMDYIPGQSLSGHTDEESLLAPTTVYKLIGQAAQAIDYAHRQGIVHRDIKPSNILYNELDERIKVSDFGIARVTDTTTTRTGTILGSPSYMAPEQMTDGKVDGRADIFSLGVTLYQLLTGELPFKGDNLASLAYQITNRKHKSIRELRPELPARIVRIINKALQKKADKRYATAQEMADALARVS